mmetsp:Transcript_42964/g.107367  ORF Transcript_42964/g.107367 Transcript_42964/m.107367 type:complete len:235 (+) Transcript_42964:525-1229(+)
MPVCSARNCPSSGMRGRSSLALTLVRSTVRSRCWLASPEMLALAMDRTLPPNVGSSFHHPTRGTTVLGSTLMLKSLRSRPSVLFASGKSKVWPTWAISLNPHDLVCSSCNLKKSEAFLESSYEAWIERKNGLLRNSCADAYTSTQLPFSMPGEQSNGPRLLRSSTTLLICSFCRFVACWPLSVEAASCSSLILRSAVDTSASPCRGASCIRVVRVRGRVRNRDLRGERSCTDTG